MTAVKQGMKELMELEALKYVLGLLQVIVSAWCWHMYTEIGKNKAAQEKLTAELAAHKLHTSESYMTKTELTRVFDAINRTLETLGMQMQQRFDKVDEKLDRKADKVL